MRRVLITIMTAVALTYGGGATADKKGPTLPKLQVAAVFWDTCRAYAYNNKGAAKNYDRHLVCSGYVRGLVDAMYYIRTKGQRRPCKVEQNYRQWTRDILNVMEQRSYARLQKTFTGEIVDLVVSVNCARGKR